MPAALLVVAADEGWMPQSTEHLAALRALDVRHGLLVVTRSDLAPPDDALAEARSHLAGTPLAGVEAVAVSGATGAGLPELRAALDRLVAGLPAPDTSAPVRLWVDRSFTIRGSGTVVTGTLGAGTLRAGDVLELGGAPVRVRALQSLGRAAGEVAACARVAVNLRGVERSAVGRGDALLTPDAFHHTGVVDVRVDGDPVEALPAALTLHLGSAAVPVAVRPLGPDTARLRLARPLPLHAGDRALLRDPGRHHIAGGVVLLDVDPPPLRRRGAAAARAAELSTMDGRPDLAGELRRRRLVRRSALVRMGLPAGDQRVAGDWLADPDYWAALKPRLAELVAAHARADPLQPGLTVEALRHALGLPDRALVEALVAPPLRLRDGRVAGAGPALPGPVAAAVAKVAAHLARAPFDAPDSAFLAGVGLGPRELAAATRAGALLRVAEGVVLLPDAPGRAVAVLAGLPQPFTVSAARQALGTSRRVAVPLLELLDRQGLTRRHPDTSRTVV